MLLPHAAPDSQEKGRLSRPEVGRGRKPLKKSIPILRLVSGTALDRLGRKFTDLESIRKEGFIRVSNLVFEIWPTRPLTILPKNKGGRPKVASNTGAKSARSCLERPAYCSEAVVEEMPFSSVA